MLPRAKWNSSSSALPVGMRSRLLLNSSVSNSDSEGLFVSSWDDSFRWEYSMAAADKLEGIDETRLCTRLTTKPEAALKK